MPATHPISRRRCLRALAGSAAALSVGTVPPLWAQGRRRPNVVFILSDDQGTVDLNCYGARDLVTPNLDALAAGGVRFTQFYVGAPMCTASRVGLLTGRYVQRALDPGTGIFPAETTLGELFQAAGYRTALFGKWHLGGSPPSDPNSQGFDEFLGHRCGAIDNYSHYNYWGGPAPRHALWRDREPYREDGVFLPDLVVRESRRFMERHRDRPFLLFVASNQPHYPLQPEPRFLGQYGHVQDPSRRAYGAAVTSLDDKVGQIVRAIADLGLAQDTIVVFMSDNGHSLEPQAGGGGGSAGPFRGAKPTLWEGGIRVPSIVSWPGHIARGQVRDQMASAMDWLPTLARYCGIDVSPLALDGRALDGRDLSGLIASPGAPSPHEALHWMIVGTYWAVREGRWKLLHRSEGRFLVDLETDPGESANLLAARRDVADRLQAQHEAWGLKPVYDAAPE